MFWRKDGTLSSAAFADPHGLSVDRAGGRPEQDIIYNMNNRFTGRIISVYVKNCLNIGATVMYMPSINNPYHAEIHGSETCPLLSKQQRLFLARKAVIVA